MYVNYNDYQKSVLKLLAHKPSRLTGSEIKFIRKYFEMTSRVFADRFSVKHTAVLKWEKQDDKTTNMVWSTEKDIRLFVLDELDKKVTALRELYHFLQDVVQGPTKPIVVGGDGLAA